MSTEWSTIPSIILLKIVSYLPLQDRLSVCSVCKSWREAALFYPKFWQKETFVFNSRDIYSLERSTFIAENTAKKIKSCTIKFESVNSTCQALTYNTLKALSSNPQLEEFSLIPTNCHTWSSWSHNYRSQGYNNIEHLNNNYYTNGNETTEILDNHCFSNQFISSAYECLQEIIKGSRGLKTFIPGCFHDLTYELLPLLEKHSRTLRTLGLASVKQDPNSYPLLHIIPNHFSCFNNLQVLTVDYDYVCDELLRMLSRQYKSSLERLVIHYHGIVSSHSGTSELAWHTFKSANPKCSLVMNLLHCYEGVYQLSSELFHPSMPLTVFRAYFCEWINVQALRLMSMWYYNSLEQLHLVDIFGNAAHNMLTEQREEEVTNPDALVMLAWRCKKLSQLTLIGYSYSGSDLVAIARLRGTGLKHLILPEECLELEDIVDESLSQTLESLVQDVSKGLGRQWRPLQNNELHHSLRRSDYSYTDEYILPFVLDDAQPTT